MKKVILTLLTTLASLNSYAGDREASGTVTVSANSGYIMIDLSGSNSTCGNRYYFKPDTDYNKALLSMMLSAQMAGKRVWVNGTGDCVNSYPLVNAYKLANMRIYN